MYALFLQARHLWRQGSADGVEQGYEMLQQALGLDPDYAPLWDAMSTVQTYRVALGMVDANEGLTLAREAAERAVAIDPEFAQAIASLAWDAMYVRKNYPRSRHAVRASAGRGAG